MGKDLYAFKIGTKINKGLIQALSEELSDIISQKEELIHQGKCHDFNFLFTMIIVLLKPQMEEMLVLKNICL